MEKDIKTRAQKIKFVELNGEKHISMTGRTAYHCHNYYADIYAFKWFATEELGSVAELKTGSNYVTEYFSVSHLANVSYCEGDVRIVFYGDLDDLKKGIEHAMHFYKENEEAVYSYTADEFLNRQINS